MTMAGETGAIATVIGHDGDRVLVSVPMMGFPPGFKLRPGERVVIVAEESGAAARPLVRTRVFSSANITELERHSMAIAGNRFALQDASIQLEPSVEDSVQSGAQVVFEVDPGSTQGLPNVIAIRTVKE
jgi:hypothetical protein